MNQTYNHELTENMSSIKEDAFGVITDICASDDDDDVCDGVTCFDVISESVGKAELYQKSLITT